MPPSPNDSTNNLLRTLRRAISRHSLLTSGDRVLTAVSGGPDSVALLHLLLRLAPEYDLSLGVAHLNHGLRGEDSGRDADFTCDLARRHDLPFHGARRDAEKRRREEKLSPEEAARNVRREFLLEVKRKEGYNRLALGHHADDNAELVLMRLISGSGPAGTAGMAPAGEDGIIRPLLSATRAEIEAFLRAEGIPWVADASNADLRFPRNRIRHRLLPMLRDQFNPAVVAALNRYAHLRRDEEEWMSRLTGDLTARCTLRSDENSAAISVSLLRELPAAARRRVIRLAAERVRGHLRRIGLDHVEAVLNLLDESGRHRRLDLPGRLRVVRTGGELRIRRVDGHLRETGEIQTEYRYEMDGPGELDLPEIAARLTVDRIAPPPEPEVRHAGQNVAFFDMNHVRFPLVVRNARPGDRFTPLGMSGSQPVSDFLINQKVPLPERPRCPVLLSGNRIIWVAGRRIDEAVKLTQFTEMALKAEIFLV
jgi:tRNA(Ile)-lysidine synthase